MTSPKYPVLALIAALALPGCASLKSSGGCLFGGATEAEDAICAARNFGVEGELYTAIPQVTGDCKDHVLATARKLAGRYATEAVVSCPSFLTECHASTLVHTPKGDFVIDNGALRYPGDVMTLAQFRDWIYGESFEIVSIQQVERLTSEPFGFQIARKP